MIAKDKAAERVISAITALQTVCYVRSKTEARTLLTMLVVEVLSAVRRASTEDQYRKVLDKLGAEAHLKLGTIGDSDE